MRHDLQTEWVPIQTLSPHPRNARNGDIEAIGESLRVNQQYRPIVVARDGTILAGNHCVDDATEALTKRGWVNGHDLREDDTILACRPDGTLSWSRVLGIFRNHEYDGPMHAWGNRGSLDALVSPGHRFMLSDGSLHPVEALIGRHHRQLRLMGAEVEDGPSVYGDAFVEVMGWAVTEGSFRAGKQRTHPYGRPATVWVRISQKPGPKADRIENALKRCGATFRVGRSGRSGRVLSFDVSGDTAALIHALAPNRVLSTGFILNLSPEQRHLLIQTMIDGDGHRNPTSTHYTQRDPAHMDAFVMLCTLAGIPTSVTTRIPPETDGEYRGSTPYLLATLRTKRTGDAARQHHSTVRYRGLIWCPTTEYGTFVARRGGKVYVTGNTYAAAMELGWDRMAVVRLDLDPDSEAARRVMLADNRTADLGRYDDALLLDLLEDLDHDFSGTGYTESDYLALLPDDSPLDLTEDPLPVIGVSLLVSREAAERWRRHRAGFTDDTSALEDLLP